MVHRHMQIVDSKCLMIERKNKCYSTNLNINCRHKGNFFVQRLTDQMFQHHIIHCFIATQKQRLCKWTKVSDCQVENRVTNKCKNCGAFMTILTFFKEQYTL